MIKYSEKTDNQLAELSQFGDIDARNNLVLRHQKLVKFLINSYSKSYYTKTGKPLPKEDLEDLFQECMIVFCKQVNKFDFSKKVKVTTYIAQWLHAKIITYLKGKNVDDDNLIDIDIHDWYDALYISSPEDLDEIGIILNSEEKELYLKLFHEKCSLTFVAKQRSVDISVVFTQKEKLFNKIRNFFRKDEEKLSGNGYSYTKSESTINVKTTLKINSKNKVILDIVNQAGRNGISGESIKRKTAKKKKS